MQIILFYWFCCQTKGSTSSVFMIPAMSEAQAAIWKKK